MLGDCQNSEIELKNNQMKSPPEPSLRPELTWSFAFSFQDHVLIRRAMTKENKFITDNGVESHHMGGGGRI